MYRKSYCATLGIRVGSGFVRVNKMLVFYGMGRALTVELSCTETGLVTLYTLGTRDVNSKFANSADANEVAPIESPHLELYCLPYIV